MLEAQHRDLTRRAAGLREGLALELRLHQAVELGERHVDRHRDRDLALVDRRHQIELRRERAVRLGLGRHDARLGLHADGEDHPVRHRCAAARRTRGSAAPRATATARPAAAWPSEIERHIFVHCLRAVCSSVRSLRSRPAEAADLLVHGAVEQRLHLVHDVELDAGDAACAPSASATLPVRFGSIRQFGCSAGRAMHRDGAADVGALVEHAAGELADVAAEAVAEHAAERAGERCRPGRRSVRWRAASR